MCLREHKEWYHMRKWRRLINWYYIRNKSITIILNSKGPKIRPFETPYKIYTSTLQGNLSAVCEIDMNESQGCVRNPRYTQLRDQRVKQKSNKYF